MLTAGAVVSRYI